MSRDLVKLNFEEIEKFIPGKAITVIGNDVTLYPLVFNDLVEVIRKVKALKEDFKKKGITVTNFNEYDKLVELVPIVLDKAPDVLEMVTGVEADSIRKLPVAEVVHLFSSAIDVNMESKDTLEGNFESLTSLFSPLLGEPEKQIKKKESRTQSKN